MGNNINNLVANSNAPNQRDKEVHWQDAPEGNETKVISTGTEQVNTGSDGLGAKRSRWNVAHDLFKTGNESKKTGGIFEFIQEEGSGKGQWVRTGEENSAPAVKPEQRERGRKEDF